jgi:hypothetical protein
LGASYHQVLASVIEVIREILDERDDAQPVEETTLLFPRAPEDAGAAVEPSPPSLDLDSLDALDIVSKLEDLYGNEIPMEGNLDELRTVGDVARLVEESVPSNDPT